jgi:hypothetical protein
MKARDWKVTLVLVLGLSMLLAITSGCGKNVAGPTAPTLSADAEEMSEAEALQNYSEACHNPSRWLGPRAWVYQYMMSCTPAKILKMGDDVNSGYFNDPIVLKTIKNIMTSNLFYLIMFKHGAAYVIVDTAVQVLSTSFSPNPGENPNNFPVKATLLPFDWNTYKLFHGSLHAGWAPATLGYILNMTSPEGVSLKIETGSQPGDIFKNSGNFSEFIYDYMCILSDTNSAFLQSTVNYTGQNNNVFFSSNGTWMRDDGQGIWFKDIHFSTADKSGMVNIFSAPDNKLGMSLEFNADGSGTGHMDIKNVRGVLTHYEYSQTADGHGWWTKNNGKKHCY